MILGKSIDQWKKEFPLLKQIINYEEVFWGNDAYSEFSQALNKLSLTLKDVQDAEARLSRFAPYLEKAFPETRPNHGIIESPLRAIPFMQKELESNYGMTIQGNMFLKEDHLLPISGSVKARGGIYEVLKRAEDLCLEAGMIKLEEDYSKFASKDFKKFLSNYSIVCGSTGNLGLSIGIMSAMLGFHVTIHMSRDAKQWKKDKLRSVGATVVEYGEDYSKAVEEGRKQSSLDPNSYFIDDENSETLFLGYAVAALRLKDQLTDKGIEVNSRHPLFIYLPCGVGGAPGGITFGLKLVFGDNVHCFFAEPTHSPCMLIGLMTKEHDHISVQDFGLDNVTVADGLAVGRASGFVGRQLHELISGVYTITDEHLLRLLRTLADTENEKLEPSALAGLAGPQVLFEHKKQHRLLDEMKGATHIAWSTGGSMVPESVWNAYYERSC